MAGGYIPNISIPVIGDGVPSDSLFLAVPGDGQVYIDQATARYYTRLKGNWIDVVAANPASLLTAPTIAAVAESFPRSVGSLVDLGALTTQVLQVVQVPLAVGALVTTLSFASGETPAGTPIHQWACLLDSARAVQATSVDATNTAWAADTIRTFTMGTPFRVTTVGPWYAGVMMSATTPNSLDGVVDYDADSPVVVATPLNAATSTPTSVTAAPALLAVQGAFTASALKPWVGVA